MKLFSTLNGLQAGCVVLMLSSVVIVLISPDQQIVASVDPAGFVAAQDEIAAPPDKNAMERFMARKLSAAQRTLAAIANDDFETIEKLSNEMIELSRQEAWERMASARFVQDTADFVSATEFLRRMAEARDPDGVALGYANLTVSCANCHSHVRRASVADLTPTDRAPHRLLAARQ